MGLIFRNTSIIINLKTRKEEVTYVGKYKNFWTVSKKSLTNISFPDTITNTDKNTRLKRKKSTEEYFGCEG